MLAVLTVIGVIAALIIVPPVERSELVGHWASGNGMQPTVFDCYFRNDDVPVIYPRVPNLLLTPKRDGRYFYGKGRWPLMETRDDYDSPGWAIN